MCTEEDAGENVRIRVGGGDPVPKWESGLEQELRLYGKQPQQLLMSPDEMKLRAEVASKLSRMYSLTEWLMPDQKTQSGPRFNYVSAAAVYDSVRKAAFECGIYLAVKFNPPKVEHFETVVSTTYTRVDTRAFVSVEIIPIDTDTGYAMEPWVGCAEAVDQSDKAIQKAMTAALKYTVRAAMLIPTGDDSDSSNPPQPAPDSTDAKTPPKTGATRNRKNDQTETPGPAPKELSQDAVRSKEISNEIGVNREIGVKINHAAKQIGIEGYKLICEAYDAGNKSADDVLLYIEAKAAALWLTEIGMDAPKLSDFKAACESRALDYAVFAAEARNAGCKTIEQIYAYLENGELPAEEQKAGNPTQSSQPSMKQDGTTTTVPASSAQPSSTVSDPSTNEEQKAGNPPSGASAEVTAPGSSAPAAQPSSADDQNPFVNEEQLISSYTWKDGELNRFKSICKAKDLDHLKTMERGITKGFTTGFQLIAWAKEGAK